MFAPLSKIINSPLRPVTVPDNQRQLLLSQQFLHCCKSISGRPAEDALGGAIAAYWSADKVVRSRIADVLNDCGIDIAQINETPWQSGTRQSRSNQHRDRQSKTGADEHATPSPDQGGPRKTGQKSFAAATTALLIISWRSGEFILSSSSRLMIEPA